MGYTIDMRSGEVLRGITKPSRRKRVKRRETTRHQRVESERETKEMKWAYGITTVVKRIDNLLPQTLASLAAGGFNNPRLFVDGVEDATAYEKFGLDVTIRNPAVKTFGNWVLALWELYLRHSEADRFALFQDDLITYRNLRQYLEQCEYPKKGYWNLYTFPENQKLYKGNGSAEWFLSNQKGKGAVALVFSRDAVSTLLQQPHIVNRPVGANIRKFQVVDGAVVDSFRKTGWSEYTHNPTLVQHTGMRSIIRNRGIPDKWKAKTFRGENFDALELLK